MREFVVAKNGTNFEHMRLSKRLVLMESFICVALTV